jgi:hypothetical protein
VKSLITVLLALCACARAADTAPHPIQVAAYYFPNYHPNDSRNEKVHGPGWSEWDLVKSAKPRYEGHDQPRVPTWGYTDESDPQVMAKKIAAAADHNIDAFIFDWYYYNDGPFLQRALDEGFLKASNNTRLKFALMWANHDWIDIHPATLHQKPKLLYPGKITSQTFDRMTDEIIAKYFKHPSYWTVDGKPYFSIYELEKLIESFGSVHATRDALDRFRAKTRYANLPSLHLNAVVWGRPILPGEKTPTDPATLVDQLGFDSVTSYTWIHHAFLQKSPTTPYEEVRDQYLKYFAESITKFHAPYFPNATIGWDSAPRTNPAGPWDPDGGYPYTRIISGSNLESFRKAVQMIKQMIESAPTQPKIITINSWNEWTEGSYLEPDQTHGTDFLDVIKDVFR